MSANYMLFSINFLQNEIGMNGLDEFLVEKEVMNPCIGFLQRITAISFSTPRMANRAIMTDDLGILFLKMDMTMDGNYIGLPRWDPSFLELGRMQFRCHNNFTLLITSLWNRRHWFCSFNLVASCLLKTPMDYVTCKWFRHSFVYEIHRVLEAAMLHVQPYFIL